MTPAVLFMNSGLTILTTTGMKARLHAINCYYSNYVNLTRAIKWKGNGKSLSLSNN
jgi:alcohol dehydrogenase class IV